MSSSDDGGGGDGSRLVPPMYDALMEGRPLGYGGNCPGFVAGLHLNAGWQDQFGFHRYFRVVGFAETLIRNKIAFSSLKKSGAYKARVQELVPPAWYDNYFKAKDWSELRAAQLDDAYAGKLQRFDKAALCILYLHAVLDDLKIGWPLYQWARIRPITFYVQGLGRAEHDAIRARPEVMRGLREETGQVENELFAKLAGGHHFVTRKTAELVLSTLKAIEDAGGLPSGFTTNMRVACGAARRRKRRENNVWAEDDEILWYARDEYLSPAAWSSKSASERAAVKTPPLPRAEWTKIA